MSPRPLAQSDTRQLNGWWSSYAGFMTLLFGVFVALYALARGEILKGGKTVSAVVEARVGALANKQSQEVAPLRAALSEVLTPSQMIFMPVTPGWMIHIESGPVFKLGQAVISQDSQDWLVKLGRTVADAQRKVRVEGFASSGEIIETRFQTPFELSAARAAAVIDFWEKKLQINSARFTVVAGGNHPPVEGEASERGLNQRVEILILRDPI